MVCRNCFTTFGDLQRYALVRIYLYIEGLGESSLAAQFGTDWHANSMRLHETCTKLQCTVANMHTVNSLHLLAVNSLILV